MIKRAALSAGAAIATGIICWLFTKSVLCLLPAILVCAIVFVILDKTAAQEQTQELAYEVSPQGRLNKLKVQRSEMARLTAQVADTDISQNLTKMMASLHTVIMYLEKNTFEVSKVSKLIEHHMPDLLKALELYLSYREYDPAWAEKFSQHVGRMEKALFQMPKQLYQHDVLSANTDMDVAVTILKKDGYLADPLRQGQTEENKHE